MRSRRSFTRRAASRPSPTPISEMRGTCYDRWGAHGKVKQLDERYPRLREGRTPAPSATIDPPVGQLDVETVVKASQAISSEMVLAALIEKLVRIAVENAGAERGLADPDSRRRAADRSGGYHWSGQDRGCRSTGSRYAV